MVLHKHLLAGLFCLNTLCLAGGVFAAMPAAISEETTNDARQDQENATEHGIQDRRSETENAKQDVQTGKNSDDIARLSGTQTFTLQLISIFMPLLSLLATGWIAFLQFKAKNERHAMAEESRANLGHVGRSINGMKSELVAAVRAAAFAEGAAHTLSTGSDAETIERLRERAAQLAKEAAAATERANRLADEAVRKIEEKPPGSP